MKPAEQPRGSGPRFCQSVLLQTFVGPNEKHFKTLELTLQATTVEHMAFLFIYCYLLTENEFVSALFKWTWKHGVGRVCGVKNDYLPHVVEGAIFPSGKERNILNCCTAKPQQQLLQAGSITS